MRRKINEFDAFTIDIDGTIKQVIPDDGKAFSEKEISYHIKSTITEQNLTKDRNFIYSCPDPQLPKNNRATLLYMHGDSDFITGKALVCKPTMIK